MVDDGGAVMKTIMPPRSANSLVNIAHSGKFHEFGIQALSEDFSSSGASAAA
jgi:hypothetical protein